MAEDGYMRVTGRLVQGNVLEPQTKNMQGAPLTDLQGNPKVQYFIAVAVLKTDAEMLKEYAKIQAIAVAGFPGGETQAPTFAWKIIDGDQPPHSSKEGFAGCYVFRFTSGFQYSAYTEGGERQITDPNELKRGNYLRVTFTAAPNKSNIKPGIYLNTTFVELIGYGEEISSGPDAKALLAGIGSAVLPAGASATPIAGVPMAMPGAAPPVGVAPPVPPVQPTPPVIPGQTAPPVIPAPPAPPVQPAPDFLTPPVMTAAANGMSYQQYIDAGWNKESLIANGLMQP